MNHVRGAPHHPQSQGKIERWHQTLKNRIMLENYFLSGNLTQQIEAFVDHYTTTATTRTSRISPRPMSTSARHNPS
ncbi:MAG: transposase [Cohaesibacteraceae bacterium]|nr:transposase [Cohaesibacteraceae bacterium]MBL4876467.1 transposase [Cohaesibacteraceae bacterium]